MGRDTTILSLTTTTIYVMNVVRSDRYWVRVTIYLRESLYAYIASLYLLVVALALREQIIPPGEVPLGEYDRKMDMIVTADGFISGES